MASKKELAQLSIKRLLNTSFVGVYKKLILKEELTKGEIVKLLSIAVILANQKKIELNRLGYRIVLSYGNQTGDYVPLYDLSINTGLVPVAELTKKHLSNNNKKLSSSEFIEEISNSFVDSFRDGDVVQTEQQLILNKIFQDNVYKSIYVVAPTSYGKSELILSTIRNQPHEKICILVPSKSLLAQTKKRLLDSRIDWVKRIVTHPEMHENDLEDAVYILTQERLSRLLNLDNTLSFGFLFVDEAHNLLDNDYRNKLLGSVISVLNYRNKEIAIKYLTPFLKDTSNLNLISAENVELNHLVDEYVKSERFYIADFRDNREEFKFYDQFVNNYFDRTCLFSDGIKYLLGNAAKKNIIYFNKPKDIEKFVLEFISDLESIEDYEVNLAIDELVDNIDKDYLLIECLRKGVVYHHGSMTDTVRHYVEFLFRESSNLKYLVSSSTLLEGVNMPIERLFLMSCYKGKSSLTASQFKNLVGRINRFNEIFFDVSNLEKLEPEVHVIAQDDYMPNPSRLNLENFLKNRAYILKSIKDNPKNVLLEKTDINDDNREDYNDTIFRLENFENGIIEEYDQEYVYTTVGKLLIAANVNEIDVLAKEKEIQAILDDESLEVISDPYSLMDLIFEAFINFSNDMINGNSLTRLKGSDAKVFYAMILDWKINKTPFKLMITRFIDHWEKQEEISPNIQIYVGKWGDEIKEDGHLEHYTRINNKTRKEKINLAIVRIKEEEDFIEHLLFRFIDILNDLELLEEGFFKKIKYGTTDDRAISLIKHGLSRGVAELVLSKYARYVDIDLINRVVRINSELPKIMRDNEESILQLFEVEMNTGI